MDAIEVVKLAGTLIGTATAAWAARRADSAAKATGAPTTASDGSLRDMVSRVEGKVDAVRADVGDLRDRVAVLEDAAAPPIPLQRKALK